MSPIPVVGFDPSLKNWGAAAGTLDLNTQDITITHLDVFQPAVMTGKQIRQNSKDLDVANQLFHGARDFIAEHGPKAVFVEVPVGSQSSRAMASYGICVGILASLRGLGMAFSEVTPTEVKLVAGSKTASKTQMIEWASNQHPSAPWPRYTRAGNEFISAAKAEHMADAVAAIHAGVQLPEFQRMLQLVA